MTLSKLVRLQPVRQGVLPHSQQVALSRALGIPTRGRPIHFPSSRAHPQINAPQRIAPALLQPFVEQRKLLRLVHPEFWSMPALLTAFDEHVLQATVREPTRLLPYKHQRLLVVFPVLPQHSCVLPTCVDDIITEQVILTYQDPRQESRCRIPIVGPLAVRLVPSSVFVDMERQQMRLTRELSWRPDGATNALEGELVDLVEDQPVVPRSFVDFFSATPTWQGHLHDISCGGAGLLLPLDFSGHAAVQDVVSLRFRLPPVRLVAKPDRVMLTMHVLGTVRAVRTLRRGVALHVRFLDRLPEAFGRLFERLEREVKHYPGQGERVSG